MPDLKVIERLNELYRKSQQGPLSTEELAERDRLRRTYLDSIKEQFKMTLDRIEIVDEAGNIVDSQENGNKQG